MTTLDWMFCVLFGLIAVGAAVVNIICIARQRYLDKEEAENEKSAKARTEEAKDGN